MAKKRNSGCFVKGDPRITHGAHKMTDEQKKLFKMTRGEFVERFGKYCGMSLNELKHIAEGGGFFILPAIDAVFVRALVMAIKKGETRFVDRCLDRVLGMPRQENINRNENYNGTIVDWLNAEKSAKGSNNVDPEQSE